MSSGADRQVVLWMSGEIDVSSEAGWLRKGRDALADPATDVLVLDLSGVQFLDSRGMTVLIRLHREALADGSTVRLRDLPPRVARALRMAGLDQVLVVESPSHSPAPTE